MKSTLLLLSLTLLAACGPTSPPTPPDPLERWTLPSHTHTQAGQRLTLPLPPRSAGARLLEITPPLGTLEDAEASLTYTAPSDVTTGRWVTLRATVGRVTRASTVYLVPSSFPAQRELLAGINALRATPRSCGGTALSAAPPLSPSAALETASWNYASRMVLENFMGHLDPQGGTPEARALAAGYTGRSVGENLGRSTESFVAITQGWLSSPEHCLNLMDSTYTHAALIGVDLENGGSVAVLMFGAP